MSQVNPVVLRQADGEKLIIFCPGCECCHFVDKRWTWNGDVRRPTFSPSLLIKIVGNPNAPIPTKDYVCHSFVRDGRIEYLGDCTHALKGQTVPLEPV